MNLSKLLVLGLLTCSLSAAYGCSASEPEEEPTSETEDELGLRRGSVDHAAIVESTTVLLVNELAGLGPVTPPLDLSLDPYNQSDPFDIAPAAFQRSFEQNLVKFDDYDGKKDWTAEQSARWVGRMASSNFLVVDTSKPCSFDDPQTYLEIERAQLTGREHATCGGRMPNEDALDVTINFVVRGPGASARDAEAIRDGVESATQKSGSTFPYLAEMN